MATAILTSARRNDIWGRDVACSYTEAAVDGSGIRMPDDMRFIQVTGCTTLNAATITPQYSPDDGTTWYSMDLDIEGRMYPADVAAGANLKLPKTFLIPGGALFRLHSSASQTDKTWTGRVGR